MLQLPPQVPLPERMQLSEGNSNFSCCSTSSSSPHSVSNTLRHDGSSCFESTRWRESWVGVWALGYRV